MRFTEELEALLRKYSQEKSSNTPEYILARYITHCLLGLNQAIAERENPKPLELYGNTTDTKPNT